MNQTDYEKVNQTEYDKEPPYPDSTFGLQPWTSRGDKRALTFLDFEHTFVNVPAILVFNNAWQLFPPYVLLSPWFDLPGL